METNIKLINGLWYAFATSGITVYSIGADIKSPYRYSGKRTDDGVRKVASPSTDKEAAMKRATRYGEYKGVITEW